ncbi:glycoside hydrolase family 16 protein [Bacillus sp. IITD106]|nr:glycoside hydrolase family 16 protein [Bacillus sp. IITD106]
MGAFKKISIMDRERNMPRRIQLTIPRSGYTRRRFVAKTDQKSSAFHSAHWSISPEVKGITIDEEGLLTIASDAEAVTFHVIAICKEDRKVMDKLEVSAIKTGGKDMPPNPLEKPGWKLLVHDEFDSQVLDRSLWSDQYLRNWSDDMRSRTNFMFEDGCIVIKADVDSQKWSPLDSAENSSIASFEKSYLHRFGKNKNEFSKIIPEFDGFATKYGYFEIRAKLPNTGDGSHVAWWMIGVQDDQNIHPLLEGDSIVDKRSSNETGEVDIIEIGLDDLKSWRPVMHPNGSTCLEYLHVPETKLSFDPGNEFHIYGFEWDENGTKFYVDNKLVQSTNRTFDYRMMTFLGLYPQGGMGKANKIFPKEFVIDYFRVYKKDEPPRPNDIRFEQAYRPHAGKKPVGLDQTKCQLYATVLDQFDQPLEDVPLIWQFSESISGEKAKTTPGALIDGDSGEITLTSEVPNRADLFVTAKVKSNLKIKKVFHVKVSTDAPKPTFIQIAQFRKLMEIKVPSDGEIYETHFEAKLLDQYADEIPGSITWKLAGGTTILDKTSVDGVEIDPVSGVLTVTSSAQKETYFFVQAISSFQAKEECVHGLDNTIYNHQLIKLVESKAKSSSFF